MIRVALLSGTLSCLGVWALFAQFEAPITILFLSVLTLFSSSYVVVWVANISAQIVREHERSTYEPLGVALSGALGANLAICGATLHRNDMLGWIDVLRKLLTGVLLFILLTVLVTTALRAGVANLFQVSELLLEILALAAVSYIDHVQSTVLGCVVGMLLPVYIRARVDTSVLAVAAFLAMQVCTVLAAALTVMVVLPGLYQVQILAAAYAEIGPTLLGLLVFYLAREGLILALVSRLAYHLNADLAEIDISTEDSSLPSSTLEYRHYAKRSLSG